MKKINSTYLVAEYLIKNKKSYIHEMKNSCNANNIGQRVLSLRRIFKWEVDLVYEGVRNKVNVFHYKLTKKGKMPNKYV